MESTPDCRFYGDLAEWRPLADVGFGPEAIIEETTKTEHPGSCSWTVGVAGMRRRKRDDS